MIMYLCKSEDGKPLDWEIGQEVWLQRQKDGNPANPWEDMLFKVIEVKGQQAVLEEISAGSA